jgi:hypothetical protein
MSPRCDCLTSQVAVFEDPKSPITIYAGHVGSASLGAREAPAPSGTDCGAADGLAQVDVDR